MNTHPSQRPATIISCVLGVSALLMLAYVLWLIVGRDDAGILETPIIKSVLVQFTDGPDRLYGPFDGANPAVCMHAPLYYRVAALMTLPLVMIGVDPIWASFLAGRVLAFASMLGLGWTIHRLSTLDGTGQRAGIFAVLIATASPILITLGVMVRPDMLALFLQTFGVLLVLASLRPGGGGLARRSVLATAFLLFGLAFCTKQHNSVSTLVSGLLIASGWWHGRVQTRSLVAVAAVGVLMILGYVAAEDLLTHGQMSRTVFYLPAGPFRAINHATWPHVLDVAVVTVKKSLGLCALAAACAWILRRDVFSRPLDRVLMLYVIAELAVFAPLCLNNAGSAENYAAQGLIFATILVGRALDRIDWVGAVSPRKWAPVGIAAVVFLANDARLVEQAVRLRRHDDAVVQQLLSDPLISTTSPDSRYFVGMSFQRLNRLYGRFDLTHDEWLYGAFEQANEAEPRSRWLKSALTNGSVRVVIHPEPDATIRGIEETLPAMGYVLQNQVGRYRIWERPTGPAMTLARHQSQ